LCALVSAVVSLFGLKIRSAVTAAPKTAAFVAE
jgi:hypothetical protein